MQIENNIAILSAAYTCNTVKRPFQLVLFLRERDGERDIVQVLDREKETEGER